jgi:hypothetical protein
MGSVPCSAGVGQQNKIMNAASLTCRRVEPLLKPSMYHLYSALDFFRALATSMITFESNKT